ncbi:MAG: hypothetical protein RMY29_018745 [Nostoc sp. CreGUA01]|nr:hypothetical protein [Nostoc sp. CreGUA01]
MGHWALGIGHRALVILSPPAPSSPLPTPHSPIPHFFTQHWALLLWEDY